MSCKFGSLAWSFAIFGLGAYACSPSSQPSSAGNAYESFQKKQTPQSPQDGDVLAFIASQRSAPKYRYLCIYEEGTIQFSNDPNVVSLPAATLLEEEDDQLVLQVLEGDVPLLGIRSGKLKTISEEPEFRIGLAMAGPGISLSQVRAVYTEDEIGIVQCPAPPPPDPSEILALGGWQGYYLDDSGTLVDIYACFNSNFHVAIGLTRESVENPTSYQTWEAEDISSGYILPPQPPPACYWADWSVDDAEVPDDDAIWVYKNESCDEVPFFFPACRDATFNCFTE